MEEKTDSIKFKKRLLLSYIKNKGNCKQFEDLIKLISITEIECHRYIIELMKNNLILYINDGYEINEEEMIDYNYYDFNRHIYGWNSLKYIDKTDIIYLPKSFLKKIRK